MNNREGSQMKKTVAYTATAILLGFAVMMVPLALQTGPPTYEPKLLPPQFSNAPTETGYDTLGEDISRVFGLAKPLNLLPPGFILLSGLIVALSVYVFLKKRIV